MATTMEFRVLGPLEVRRDDRAVELPGGKPRAVLAVVLLHANEPVSAERLAVALWGEEAPHGAVKTVQVHVSRLRKALGEADMVATTPAGYCLRVRPGELDAERFAGLVEDGRRALAGRRPHDAGALLREALELWRGPPLADLAFEPFAQPELARLEEQRLQALEVRVEADLASGRDTQLVPELQRLVGEHPMRERLRGQLMLALYRAGRQADALAVYRRARELLVDQLGIEPAAELRRLEQAILAHNPDLEPATTTASSQPSATESPLAATLRLEAERPLFGREREREQLAAAWQTVISGERRFVLVDGEAGIGKTRLAAEVARLVYDAGHTVLYGACDEALAVPGRPLVDALRPYIAACDATTLRDRVGSYGGDLARLLPEIAVRLPDVTPSPSRDLEVEQLRLLDALVHLLASGGHSAPLLLVVDDLHWADELTLLALRHMARTEQAPSVLIVGTFRPSEPWRSRLLAQLVAEAARRRDVLRLELGPLTAADVGALMGSAGVDDASSVVAVHAATDGNPFFLVEMLHALSEGRGHERTRVPTGVRDVLRARLARMPEGASGVVATAALIGREFDVSLLLDLCDDDEAVMNALERAERAQLCGRCRKSRVASLSGMRSSSMLLPTICRRRGACMCMSASR